MTAEKVYLDRPTDSPEVLLKICKLLLRIGNHCLETYTLLDDGSKRNILLHLAAQKLELIGLPEELVSYIQTRPPHPARGISDLHSFASVPLSI